MVSNYWQSHSYFAERGTFGFRNRYIATLIILVERMQIMHISKSYQTHLSPAEDEVLEQEDVNKLVNVVEESLDGWRS